MMAKFEILYTVIAGLVLVGSYFIGRHLGKAQARKEHNEMVAMLRKVNPELASYFDLSERT